MKNTATVLSSLPKTIVEAARSYQVDAPALLQAAGVDPIALDSPGARIPNRAVERLWTLAREATGDPCLGLVAARHAYATSFHALGFGWLASSNLGDTLKRLVRYERLLMDMPWVVMETTGTRTAVRLSPPDGEPVASACRIDAAFAVLMRWCDGLTHDRFQPSLVEFRHPDHGQRQRYEEVFGTSLRFGAELDRFWFENPMLSRPLPGRNPALAAEADRIADDYLASMPDKPITGSVRQLLLDLLPQGEADLESVAGRLQMSPRSLQRHLGDEGQSFRALLEQTRKTLAMSYVRSAKEPLVQVAFRLGFSDHSSFSKAFKRWTGLSPAAYAAAGRAH